MQKSYLVMYQCASCESVFDSSEQVPRDGVITHASAPTDLADIVFQQGRFQELPPRIAFHRCRIGDIGVGNVIGIRIDEEETA